MSANKVILIGCSAVTLFAVLLVAIFTAWIIHASQDVEGVSIAVNTPLDVTVGETIILEVVIMNERENDPLSLSDIDISNAFLAGFTVISTQPTPKSSMHVPIDNSRSYTFNISIPAGESKTFKFTLRAETTGIYRGDVDVCEGMRFITAMAQTVIKEE